MKIFRNIFASHASVITFLFLAILFFSSSCFKKEAKEIMIGAILALTGDSGKYGESSKRGIDLGIEEINNAGGILGRSLRIIYEDSEADPKKAVAAFQKLVNIHKITAIIGPMTSSSTLAVAPIAEQHEVVVLTPTASAPSITNAGDYIFRNVASDMFEGTIMARFAFSDLNLTKIAILYINNDFGLGLRDAFSAEFIKLGGIVTIMESFEQNATDFRTQITKISQFAPEGIYIVGYNEMGRIVKQVGEFGIKAQILSFSMFEDPGILEIASSAANGTIFTSQSFSPNIKEEGTTVFFDKYKEKYGVFPDIFAGLAYDAVRILALAIERGGLNSIEIKDSLYNITNFPGITGETSFDKYGDVEKVIHFKLVVENEFIWYLGKK